jgi:hypothetical protein
MLRLHRQTNLNSFPKGTCQMSKILYVASEVQAVLMTQIYIPEFQDGFWKNHRPSGHGQVWQDVEVKVSEDGNLGCVGFESPRNYNLLNKDYVAEYEEQLVSVAQTVKPTSTFKTIKKEIVELLQIIGNRLKNKSGEPIKLYRGNHRPGTATITSSKARNSSSVMVQAAIADIQPVAQQVNHPVKNTAVKCPTATSQNKDAIFTEEISSNGAIVRRAPANLIPPVTNVPSSIFALADSIANISE